MKLLPSSHKQKTTRMWGSCLNRWLIITFFILLGSNSNDYNNHYYNHSSNHCTIHFILLCLNTFGGSFKKYHCLTSRTPFYYKLAGWRISVELNNFFIFILLIYFVTDFLYRIKASVIEPNKNPGII